MTAVEQVTDLQAGDVVRAVHPDWPKGSVLEGPVGARGDYFWCCTYPIARTDGTPVSNSKSWTITFLSRAPRPLYVNHPRTKPMPGDVARDEDRPLSRDTWFCNNDGDWVTHSGRTQDRSVLPERLRLLVDGETGQVVTS